MEVSCPGSQRQSAWSQALFWAILFLTADSSRSSYNLPDSFFERERGDELLGDDKEKETRNFPSYIIILFCHPQILPTCVCGGGEGSCALSSVGHACLCMSLFLAPRLALDPDLVNQNTVTST